MKNRLIRLTIILLIACLALTACERSATGGTIDVPVETEVPFPAATTQSQLMADILKQTQTAAALFQPSATSEIKIITSTPGFVFNTPEVNASYTPEGTQSTVNPTAHTTSEFTNTPEPTATATVFNYPTPTPGHPATYKLLKAEYPYCIARRFNVDPSELLTLNNLTIYSYTYEGMELKIPSSGSFPGERARIAHPATYTVQAGDSIGSIACMYGDADPNTIWAANGLPNGSILVVGQVLQIP